MVTFPIETESIEKINSIRNKGCGASSIPAKKLRLRGAIKTIRRMDTLKPMMKKVIYLKR